MALSRGRILAEGSTPYPHEREGIAFALDALPDTDPFHAWTLVDLLDPSTGRLLEIDLLVLGTHCLYLVELKAWPGKIEGDSVDWQWTAPGERTRWRDNPRRLANRKAQILKSQLERKLPPGTRAPWVEALVFLSHKDVKLGLSPEGIVGVVNRTSFAHAITHHEYRGADPRPRERPINRPMTRDIVNALRALGFRTRRERLHAGSYQLDELLCETASYQDRAATHREIPAQRRRARTYLVPDQTSLELRQQLRRAADREAQLLYEVREHPNILHYTDYVADAELGPTVLFDAFDDGVPLDAYLRQPPELSFGERIAIIREIGRALDHCHQRGVIHGGLSPSAVLVRRRGADAELEIRIFNFQLGGSGDVDATSHRSILFDEEVPIYQAPEIRTGASGPSPQSDIFSLGAIAYLLLARRAPGATLAEVDARLRPAQALDPRDSRDDVPPDIAELVALATNVTLAARADDVTSWIELLLAHATAPSPPAESELNPLSARPGEVLPGGLKVISVLGHGASSRVLEVERADGRSFALKVSLGPDHDARLTAEARILGRLRHPRIVELESPAAQQPLLLGGRPCLLMTLAGRTLQRELASQGAVSLDFAARYGADLLGAVEHLEDEGLLHRDIKPANVGVGALHKKLSSLTLFDFSLAGGELDDVRVGTAAYRDPMLPIRGRWDHAADRYSAAVTLYELVTGQRPAVDTATGDDAGPTTVRVAAERFDASVRDRLAAFFQTAFARDVAARHASARVMRQAWERATDTAKPAPVTVQADTATLTVTALDATATTTPPPSPGEATGIDDLTDVQLAGFAADTAVQALPLSARAKNALDRAGLLRVADLLPLPPNRLSAIRGVGKQVAEEILRFRDRWRAATHLTTITGEPPFFPGFRGDDVLLPVALPVAVAEPLGDAGFRTLGQVASAPGSTLTNLAGKGLDVAAVRAALVASHTRATSAQALPTTIDGWIDALLPAGKKRTQHVRELFGLEGPLAGQIGTSPRAWAMAHDMTAPAVYIALGKCRPEWAKHPAIATLVDSVKNLVQHAGGALALDRAATELLAVIPHAGDAGPAGPVVRAAALVRLVAELEKDNEAGVRFVRLDADAPWILRDESLEGVVRQLGATADELSARDIIAGPAEAGRALRQVVEAARDAGLSELAPDRLLTLAASASRRAAVSSRLEIYPRDMEPRRALELSSGVLSTGMTEDDVRRRVAARYPAAAALPPRPELDELLAPYGLRYAPAEQLYQRPGEEHRSSLHTSLRSPLTSYTVVRGGAEISARDVAIGDFEDQVRLCLERRSLLVLGVTADRAPDAEHGLASRFGLVPRSFDALFLAELEQQMKTGKVNPDRVYTTDGAGRGGEHWPNLRRLAESTAAAVAKALLPPTQPLLLTQPGLIGRYQLEGFLARLVSVSRDHDDAAAIVVLVPGHEGGRPTIGDLAIPGLLPGQSTWIPRPWLSLVSKKEAA